jgi:hypothetical protein
LEHTRGGTSCDGGAKSTNALLELLALCFLANPLSPEEIGGGGELEDLLGVVRYNVCASSYCESPV